MIASSRSYAIGRVHFQIAGGWRMLISLAIVYFGVIGIVAGLWEYYDLGGPRGRIPLSIPVTLLLALEGIVLVVFGATRVATAIRTDLSSSMIESHRLMPVSAPRALLGYLFGATSHATAFLLFNIMITLIIGMHAGGTFSRIILNHAILLAFAVFIWSFVAIGTFLYRNMLMMVMGAAFFATVTNQTTRASILFPGIDLLLTPFFGPTVFTLSSAEIHWTYPVAILAQAAFCAVFFAAACRMYRGSYATTFSLLLALLLLTLWAVISAIGIHESDHLPTGLLIGFGRRRAADPLGTGSSQAMVIAQVITALLSSGLLSLVTLWTMTKNDRRKPFAWPLQAVVVILVALLSAIPALGAANTFQIQRPAFISLLVLAAHAWTALLLLRILCNARPLHISLGIAMSFILLWLGPLLAEAFRQLLFRPDDSPAFPLLFTMSPLGALINAWATEGAISPLPGLFWQFAVPALLTLAMALLHRPAKKIPPASNLNLSPPHASTSTLNPP